MLIYQSTNKKNQQKWPPTTMSMADRHVTVQKQDVYLNFQYKRALELKIRFGITLEYCSVINE